MKALPLPSQAELKKYFRYDQRVGVLYNLVNRGPHAKAGEPAGWKVRCGIRVKFHGQFYLAHRLIWVYLYGHLSEDVEVDHWDGNPWNNKRKNIRLCIDGASSNQENQRKAHSDNCTGLQGVSLFQGKFPSRICVKGEQIYLGTFGTPQEAHVAYLTAKRELHRFCTI